MNEIHLQINQETAGMRLDRVVALHSPTLPRALILEAIANGLIRVNGRRAAKGDKLREGDDLHIQPLAETSSQALLPNPDILLDLLYEDAELLAFNKPAGQPVHPLSADETDTLANGLLARYPELAEIGGDPLFPALLHRIDTDTSGLVLAARTPKAYTELRRQFREQTVTKIYTALVHGTASSGATLDHYLAHQQNQRGKMVVITDLAKARKANAFKAITRYDIQQKFAAHTLLRVTIHTGVTHQIRCQLAHAGFPLVGDKTYGDQERRLPEMARHFLHAASLTCRHPATGRKLNITAPLPPDLEEILRRVSKKR